ncbi:MAG: serine/threonine protein kinase [Planctomycetes bacterium]|nr:serine/threonine protein kinase [Planctomycetota bacterium]
MPSGSAPDESAAQYSSPDQFARLAAAFERLRPLPSLERERRLEALAVLEPGITTALRALFAQHDDDPEALAAPERAFDHDELAAALADAAPAGCAADDDVPPPQRVGPYRVLRRIGHGGMGVVYLAEHADPDLRRKVAIKVLRSSARGSDALRRFRRERRILGALQHPNIATLYDGGVTEDGQPFVAMEFVDGTDLLSHCDQRRLSVEQRLRLFEKVCRAVAHAHRALVVHRDLKPGNILVTDDGEPKLLDFGIAKLVDEADEQEAAPVTRTGEMMLTPDYASPEQVRGEAVTTATDVYALGLVLYELLTGVRAQRRDAATGPSLYEAICERMPTAPSAAVLKSPPRDGSRPETGTRLVRRLAGDLDTIVAQAIKKEPARRYHSAEALAADVERHLRGLPVTARPDTIGYRARKFVARHRLGVGAATVLLSLGVAFVVVTAQQNRTIRGQLTTIREQNATIRAERDKAMQERAVADRVVQFLVSLYDMAAPDPERAEQLRARELLDLGARRVERELANLPQQRAPMQLAMGRAYQALGLYDDALPLLEAAERTFGEIARDGFAHREAQFVLAGAFLHLNETARGEQLLRSSWQPLADGREMPAAIRAARRMALTTWLRDQGRFDEALQLLGEANRLVDGSPLLRIDLALSEAEVRRDRGELEKAQQLAEAALRLSMKADGPDHPHQARVRRVLAQVLHERGDTDAAREELLKATAIDRNWAGDRHPDVDADLFALAMVEIDDGDWQSAEATLREVVERDRRRFGARHPMALISRAQLAMVTGNEGHFDDAEREFREVLALMREVLPEDHLELATTLANFATLLQRQRRLDEAAPLYEEALAIRQRVLPEDHPAVLTTRNQLGVIALDRGDFATAEPLLRQVLEARRRVRGEHEDTANSMVSLATCLMRTRRAAEAAAMFAEATAMFRRTTPAGFPGMAHSLIGEARAHQALGDPAAAEPLLREASAQRHASLGDEHFDTLYADFSLLRCLMQRQSIDEARAVGAALLEQLRRHLPADHPMTASTEQMLAELPGQR